MKKLLFVLIAASFISLINGQATYAQDVNSVNSVKMVNEVNFVKMVNEVNSVKPIEGQITIDENAKPQNVGNKICPVSGVKVGESGMEPATYEYEGKIYNFCCAGCIEEFNKDPKKYIEKVEKELQAEAQKQKDAVLEQNNF